jgi:hypothetical protein
MIRNVTAGAQLDDRQPRLAVRRSDHVCRRRAHDLMIREAVRKSDELSRQAAALAIVQDERLSIACEDGHRPKNGDDKEHESY